MSQQTRPEIEKFVTNAYAVARDRILQEHAKKKKSALAQVGRTHNSGGYLPALTKWGAECVREMILAHAEAYAKAFTIHGVPSDREAEKTLETAGMQFAAGTISGILGELDLLAKRTGRPRNAPGGSINREINHAMASALKEGKLRLQEQRIMAERITNQPTESKGEATTSVATPAKAIAEGAMERLSSWQQIRETFLEGATAYPDLEARWDSSQWKLWDKPVGETLKAANPSAERLFIETARLAVTRLGKAREDQPCWHTWLDLMRGQKRGSRPSSPRGRVGGDGRWRVRRVFAESADFCADRAAAIESKLTEARAVEDGLPKAASPDHAEAVENQKGRIQTALKEAWRQREPVQRVEDDLRPMVPGVGKLRGRPFWLQLWAYLRRPSVYGMQRSEFMDLAPEDIYALLSGGADVLPDDRAGTEPRPARGGRRSEKLDVDTESLRKDWIGDTSLKAFARFSGMSEDTLQRVLKTGTATKTTLDAIGRAGKVKGLKLNKKSLTKNPPQKPQ